MPLSGEKMIQRESGGRQGNVPPRTCDEKPRGELLGHIAERESVLLSTLDLITCQAVKRVFSPNSLRTCAGPFSQCFHTPEGKSGVICTVSKFPHARKSDAREPRAPRSLRSRLCTWGREEELPI